MRLVLALLLASAAISAAQTMPPRAPTATRPTGEATLSGTIVTNDDRSQPIRRARVLATAIGANVTRATDSDEAGRFSIDGLPAGSYSLSVTKPGFVRTAYGARRPDGAGTPIALASGQRLSVGDVRLTRGSVVTGTVFDEQGIPAFGVTVTVQRHSVQGGERMLAPVAGIGMLTMAQTDDRGVYRLYGLPPGTYVVTTAPIFLAPTGGDLISMSEGVAVAYAPVYFPGTSTASNATVLTLGPGEERTAVDMQLRLVRTARVEGTLVVPAGMSPQSADVSLVEVGETRGGLQTLNVTRGTAIGADGKFSFRGITPGRYVLAARAGGGAQMMTFGSTGDFMATAPPPAPGRAMPPNFMPRMPPDGGGPALWGQADVTVDGVDITNVSMSLQPGMTMTGRLTIEGGAAASIDWTGTRVTLLPDPGANRGMVMNVPQTMVSADGEFTITGITPGALSAVVVSSADRRYRRLEARERDCRRTRHARLSPRDRRE